LNQQRLRDFLQLLSIAHHIPGRVRLKLEKPQAAQEFGLDINDATKFAEALRKVKGIRSTSLNTIALSCTVNYDTNIIPVETWANLPINHSNQQDLDRHASKLIEQLSRLIG
jgi:acetylornithine deacetylase/succinyl-diaminopimelate desuccinylase-like protein